MADEGQDVDPIAVENLSGESKETKPTKWKQLRTFLFKNYLPLSLIFLVVFGILLPPPGIFFSQISFHYACIVGLFLHSGIKLRTGEIKDALRAWKALLLNMVIIMLITPIIGAKLTSLLPFGGPEDAKIFERSNNGTNLTRVVGNNNETDLTSSKSLLGPEAFMIGIQLYFCVPCTISAGVFMVAQAGGNATLALMTTVICNVLAVFTVPLLMKWLMAIKGVQIDVLNLLMKLVLTVLVPLLVGKGMRYIPKVKPFVKKFSDTLKLISITLLVMIPWMKVSVSSQGGAFSTIPVAGMFANLAWGIALHLAFMLMNILLSVIFRIDPPATKCVVILASQKSLTVAITILALLPIAAYKQGLIALPMILIHLGILVLDSIIVTLWYHWDLRAEKKKALKEEVFLDEEEAVGNGHCFVDKGGDSKDSVIPLTSQTQS